MESQLKENILILKNQNIELELAAPLTDYGFSRFDWTGKITNVKYRGIPVSTNEKSVDQSDEKNGKGFYNEFGIEKPIGFDEIAEGEWFCKPGIGWLQKQGEDYLFSDDYKIKPASFKVAAGKDSVHFVCSSGIINGYSFRLVKEISLIKSGFVIRYDFENTGQKHIRTNEYCHNFLTINNEPIGADYNLSFASNLDTAHFDKIVNDEEMVSITSNKVIFVGKPSKPFFFSNLTGGKMVDAFWQLINHKTKIGISEKGNFKTKNINLLGWGHVVSPELFIDIDLLSGQSMQWSRTYKIFEME